MNEQEKKQAKAKLGDQEQPQANEDTQAAAGLEEIAGTLLTAEAPALPAELTELATALREFGGVGALMDAVKGIKANSDRQKAQLVQRLAANSRCAFSQAELEAMTAEQLAKLEASIVPGSQTYVGRNGAGPAVNLDGDLRVYKGAAVAKQDEATKA